MTLYLKYRPQQISELDLVEARQSLTDMLESGNVPHALLLSGPRGIGKTSSARILAKAVNCQTPRKGTVEPCNECGLCRSITEGNCVDVVEIDAASNRGIDEIRNLREQVGFAPMQAKKKVYIVDEVHMLTNEAANALLKTLEEPPEHVMFILCTTDPQKLPETVVSRCIRLQFRKPTGEELEAKLLKVAKAEKIKLDKEMAARIVRIAKGSFRDGIKILEQVGVSGDKAGQVVEMLSAGGGEELAELVIKGESGPALKLIADAELRGVPMRQLAESAVEEMRLRILEGFTAKSPELRRLAAAARSLESAYEEMKLSAVPQLALELWVIDQAGEPTAAEPKPKVKVDQVSSKTEPETEPDNKGDRLDELKHKWVEVMKAVRPKNHSVEALLRSTQPVAFDGQKLVLEVFYKFHKEKLETEKCRQIVEEAVGGLFGGKVALRLKLGETKKAAKPEVDDAELVKAAEAIFS